MAKIKYIFYASLILLIFFLASRRKEKTEEVDSSPTEVVAKIPTKFDSLTFKYDSLLSQSIDETGTVGAAVAIIHDGEIAFTKCYGVRKFGESDSINEKTVFRLASVSKAVTGVLAGILTNDGSIDLDEKVIDYLPGFKLKDSINTHSLTLRHVLSHTSGLVPHAYDNLIEAKIDFKTIIDSMVHVDISAEPGQLYSYQNAIFSLIDTISTLKTSKKFNALLNEKLFQPFNMHTATTGFKPFEDNDNKAFPHVKIKDVYAPAKLNDRYYNTIPAAGINASISDMASLVQHLLKHESFYKNLTDTILEPQIYTPLRRSYFRRWGKVDTRHYGLGWRIVGYKGNTIAYHGGYVRGYRAEVAFCREANIGIVYLSNSPSLTASISIPTFLNLYFDSIEQQNL